MTPLALAAAADAFAAARAASRLVTALPPDVRPETVADGWRVQAEISRRAGGPLGWKVSAVTQAQQGAMGVSAPIAARLLGAWFAVSPARFVHARFVAPKVECEIAFRLGRDLPPRPALPYAPGEVADAIDALVPAIEIADSRLPPRPPIGAVLADQMASGAFVHGAAATDWRAIDRAAIVVTLRIDGVEIGVGRGDALLPDPLLAVIALANAPPPGSAGLRRGEIVTTGAIAPVTPIAAGSEAVADFGALGAVRVRFES